MVHGKGELQRTLSLNHSRRRAPQTGSRGRRFTVVAIRKLTEEVEASGDSTQKIRELVEALSDQVGVEHDEGDHSSRQGVWEQLLAVGLADEAQQESLYGHLRPLQSSCASTSRSKPSTKVRAQTLVSLSDFW